MVVVSAWCVCVCVCVFTICCVYNVQFYGVHMRAYTLWVSFSFDCLSVLACSFDSSALHLLTHAVQLSWAILKRTNAPMCRILKYMKFFSFASMCLCIHKQNWISAFYACYLCILCVPAAKKKELLNIKLTVCVCIFSLFSSHGICLCLPLRVTNRMCVWC